MQESLIQQGVDMMLYGMGTVFIFLIVLVLAISLMSRLVAKFSPAAPLVPVKAAETAEPVDALTAKIIQAAIAKHRAR
tara:strand:- start:3267 stop:3500 length:234 start_codon:yes stop_codon:yes gene_type:complete